VNQTKYLQNAENKLRKTQLFPSINVEVIGGMRMALSNIWGGISQHMTPIFILL